MPPVRAIGRRNKGVVWAGECPHWNCGHEFRVDAESWMQKNHVLIEVRDLNRERDTHLHGDFVVTAYEERGGE